MNSTIEKVLKAVVVEFEQLPDSKELSEKVCKKLQNTYDNPPKRDFEILLQKVFSDDELRLFLFEPLDFQIEYFSRGIKNSLQFPAENPLRKAGSLLLTIIYLYHRKSLDFIQNYILADGFDSLILLLKDDSLYERSQAFEILASMTDCDLFDWFVTPETNETKKLHSKLLQLNNNPEFLQNLLLNREASYPGGSFRALQLLAFWLSWVRALYTSDQKLKLSPKLIEEIHSWSICDDSDSNKDGLTEEKKLAQTLYDDFITAGISDNVSESKFYIQGIETAPFSFEPTPIKQQDLIFQNIEQCEKLVETLKEEGNQFYKSKRYIEAKNKYYDALRIAKNLLDLNILVSDELLNIINTNLANSLWKIYEKDPDNNKIALDQIIEACNNVLRQGSFHSKAYYRIILAYIELNNFSSCYQMIDKFQTMELTSSISDADKLLFHRIKWKCLAKELVTNHPIDKSRWNFDEKRFSLFKALLRRFQISDLIDLPPEQFYDLECKVLPEHQTRAPREKTKISFQELESITLEIYEQKKVPPPPEPLSMKESLRLTKSQKSKIKELNQFGKKIISFIENQIPLSVIIIEQKEIILASYEIIRKLFHDKLALKDIYPSGFMDESDLVCFSTVLFYLGQLTEFESEKKISSTFFKIIENLNSYDRIQSLLFMSKMSFPSLKNDILQQIEFSLKISNLSKKQSECLQSFQKHWI